MSEFIPDVEVSWSEARGANELLWDDRAALHEGSGFYGVQALADDPHGQTSVIRDELPVLLEHLGRPDLSGLDLLHLQCHIGTDTLSLARAGARTTGLDLSANALEVARRVFARAGIEGRWVKSDALAARSAVEGDFDVVYSSVGVLCWLSDLDTWAQQIAALLKQGGVFFLRDGHPMLYAIDDEAPTPTLRYRYFANGRAQTWDDGATYAGDGTTEHTRSYEFPHALSEILGSLIRAGLIIERFDEGRTLPWQGTPQMRNLGDGTYAWPDALGDVIPCTFTVIARKP